MNKLHNILPARPTILKWLFLVVLSTGSSLFRDAASSSTCQTEQVYTAESRLTAGKAIALFHSATDVTIPEYFGLKKFSLVLLSHFARSIKTRYHQLGITFFSFSYKLRLINLQPHNCVSNTTPAVFPRS
ncbi:hypothetical protein [Dyadobacter crusticola]|uniref:hypothetical protein n=1 Tax=Dyadobacter crusticola TaxID=292407 RepID=UPI0012F9B934|nr:hypothetical protein [Dyadobacter crusticola]